MAREIASDLGVRKVKPPAVGQQDYRIRGCGGLRLRVSASGAKTWTQFYRFRGKLRRGAIGTYPAVTLEQAHIAWAEARDTLRAGDDPYPPRTKTTDETTAVGDNIKDAAEDFLKRHGKKLRPRTRQEYERPIRQLVIPRWGTRAPTEVQRKDVLALIDDVAEKRGPVAANRTLSIIKVFFNWAVDRGLVEMTPCATVKAPTKEQSRDRVLDDRELAAVWSAFGELKYPFGDFLRVLMLTAQRRQEVAGMRWADLDLEGATWTMPAASTKAGREHGVPLAPLVLDIIRALPRLAMPRGDFVFSGSAGERPVSGFSAAKTRIDTLAKGLPQWQLHDLRRSAASNMARVGFPPHVVAAVLNHSPGRSQGITAVYNRYRYGPEKRAALEAWAAHVERLTGAKAMDQVVELRTTDF